MSQLEADAVYTAFLKRYGRDGGKFYYESNHLKRALLNYFDCLLNRLAVEEVLETKEVFPFLRIDSSFLNDVRDECHEHSREYWCEDYQ